MSGCLDVWMPACLSPGHLHAHHFFTQTAAPSLERKLAVAVDPQSQRAGAWDFPNRWGIGNRVNLRSLNPALFVKSVTWTKYHLKIDYMPCHIKVKSSVLSKRHLLHSISIWWWGCIFESICTTYCICIAIPLLKHKALVADKLRTSSSWQERLEHLSEEFMRS